MSRAEHRSRGRSIAALVVSFGLAFAVAATGAIASVRAAEFYRELVRPAWAPPAGVFGPVWTCLYCCMAVAAWLVWRERSARGSTALAAYAVQLGLNALWSWLFFAWRQGAWAFAEVIVLWAAIVVTVVLFWRIRPAAGLLLLPYLLWVSFATALTYAVWQRNPGVLA